MELAAMVKSAIAKVVKYNSVTPEEKQLGDSRT